MVFLQCDDYTDYNMSICPKHACFTKWHMEDSNPLDGTVA